METPYDIQNTENTKLFSPSPKYSFTDIFIFCRKQNGVYVSFSDYEFKANVNHEIIIDGAESEYVLAFNAFVPEKRCYAPVTLNEIMSLANVREGKFLSQMMKGSDNGEKDCLILYYCAKKILDYRYGRCKLIQCNQEKRTGIYTFARHDGKGNYPIILQKEFKGV